jgi:hypothetical protein
MNVVPLLPDRLGAAGAVVIGTEVVDISDTPPGDVVEELLDADDDVPVLGVDSVELIDEEVEGEGVGVVGVNRSEMPFVPSTDPV